MDFLYDPTAVALHYGGPAGASLGIILRERQRRCYPEGSFAAQRGKTSWNAESSRLPIADPSNSARENYACAYAGRGISLPTRAAFPPSAIITIETCRVIQLVLLVSIYSIGNLRKFGEQEICFSVNLSVI